MGSSDASVASWCMSRDTGSTLAEMVRIPPYLGWSAAGLGLGAGAAGVTMISPVSIIGDTIQIVRGDDYALVDGRSLEWSSALWPTLVGASISWGLFYNGALVLTAAGTVVTGGVGITQTVSVDLTAAQTAALAVGYPGTDGRGYSFDVQAVLLGGHSITLQRGTATVLEDYTP